MPTTPDPAFPQRVVKPWLAVCSLQSALPPDAPTMAIKVNGKHFTHLLDSRSMLTLACTPVLNQLPKPTAVLPVFCVHRDVREVPTAKVLVSSAANKWMLSLG